MKRVLVVGATGDVGGGLVSEFLAADWEVVAAARSEDRLARLVEREKCAALKVVSGDLGSEASAVALWEAAVESSGGLDAAVVSVNAFKEGGALFGWSTDNLLEQYAGDVMTHFNAVKAFVPRLPDNGVFLGIGGGTADFAMPRMTHMSMSQAALRMMYRGIARERRGTGCAVRELMIVSMVNGPSTRGVAQPHWLTEREIGRHACAILSEPDTFKGPVLTLSARENIGQVGDQRAA